MLGNHRFLKIINGDTPPADGNIEGIANLQISYVEQIPLSENPASGAEKFNQALSAAIAQNPDVLLLDEPTNHLDKHNRRSLIRMLNSYPGTVIVATHDMDLIRNFAEIFWHIENGEVHQNHFGYDEFIREQNLKRCQIEEQINSLHKDKKAAHASLMKEQKRAKNSKSQGEKNIVNRKWPTVVSQAKARRAEETSGGKQKAISHKRENLADQLSAIKVAEVIVPKFSIESTQVVNKMHVNISDGAVGL